MALTKVNRGGLNTGIADSSNATAITISSSEIVTLADDLIIKDSGTIGSASKTDAITIAASGNTQLRSTGIAAGSQVFQIIDDGTTVLNVRSEDGNINFPVAGAGIFLGVTAAAASNLLDDYEEGTWTPSLSGPSAQSGTWGSALIGTYTKVGRQVTLHASITGSGMRFTGTAGYYAMTGVPFAAAQPTNSKNYSGSWSGDSVGNASGGSLYLNASTMYLHSSNSGQADAGVSGIGISMTYFTA